MIASTISAGEGVASEVAVAMAGQAYKVGIHPTIRQVAESQGLACSTLYGCLNGRQSRSKVNELSQPLVEAEEKKIVQQIEDMDRQGFPICLAFLTAILSCY